MPCFQYASELIDSFCCNVAGFWSPSLFDMLRVATIEYSYIVFVWEVCSPEAELAAKERTLL